MDSISSTGDGSDRPFDPAKVPVTAEAQLLVKEVSDLLELTQARVRRRQPNADRIHKEALAAIVSDVAYCAMRDPGKWLAVEMSKDDLTPARRRAPFLTEQFRTLIHQLSDTSVQALELRKGYRSALGSRRSTVRATPWLLKRQEELGLELSDFGRRTELLGDPLVLRSPKIRGAAVELPLPDTLQVTRLRAEMHEVNSWLSDADLEYAGCAHEDRIDLGQRFLRRIFNDGSLHRGGRLHHGFWQDMPKDQRRHFLRIEGQPIASVDFAQMSVRLAYAQVGAVPPDGDLYSIPGLGGNSREGIKRVMNAMLASDKLPTRMPQGTRSLFPSRVKIADVVEGITRSHPQLARVFGSSQGTVHQNMESRVILCAILELKALGVVALPVHDCLLTRWDQAGLVKEVMERAFEEVSGGRGQAEIELSPPAQALIRASAITS